MQEQFKCKNAKIFLVNTGKVSLGLWNTFKGWIDPMIVNKVQVHARNTCDELIELVAADQLLEEYGGSSKWPGYFWPPHIPNARLRLDPSHHTETCEES